MSIAANQPAPMTRQGYERLSAELDHLKTVRRREVDEWLREARDDGAEPGENTGVAAALEEQAALERRIDELEAALASARIADPPADGVAGIGQRVLVRMSGARAPIEYHLVGPLESDPAKRLVSVESPVGEALVGRRAGDRVEVETPGGPRTVEILEVGEPA